MRSTPPSSRHQGVNCPEAPGTTTVRSVRQAALIAVLVIGVLAGIIVGGTWAIGGRGLADRAATDLLMPFGALWLALLACLVFSVVRRRWTLAVVFAVLWVAVGISGNRPLGDVLVRRTEFPAERSAVKSVGAPLDAVVLLGGYASVNPWGFPELGSDGQRLLSTAQLWHADKVKTIICTGEAHVGQQHPAKLGRQLLVSVGVPDSVIFEVGGENTAGEMRALERFFQEPPQTWLDQVGDSGGNASASPDQFFSDGRIGLLTSAYHLPRAMRLAQTRDLSFRPLPCGFRGSGGAWTPRDWVPAASGAKSVGRAWKEWLAGWVGR